MMTVYSALLFYTCLIVGLSISIREPTIKQLIGFLVMISGILGALLTFFLTLPPSENIFALTGIIATMIAVIAAAIKMLREMEKVVEKEVTIRVTNSGGI